jgi:hypothetical protein
MEEIINYNRYIFIRKKNGICWKKGKSKEIYFKEIPLDNYDNLIILFNSLINQSEQERKEDIERNSFMFKGINRFIKRHER